MTDRTDGVETSLKWVVDEPCRRLDVEERPCGEDLDCYNQLIIMKTSKSNNLNV